MAKKTINQGSGKVFRESINDNFSELYELRDVTEPSSIGFTVNGKIRTGINQHTPLFSVSFDDTRLSAYTGWFPFFTNLGLVGSLAVCTKRPSAVEIPETMTWEQITEMNNAGWEIMSHSVNHIAFQTLTEEQAHYEFAESKRVLESRGFNPKNFAWPVSEDVGDTNRRICREYYKSARGYYEDADNKDPVNEVAFNPYNIKSCGERVDITTPEGMAWTKAQVDIAYNENRWMIWTGHSHTEALEPAMLELIQYVQSKGIEIVTIDDGINLKYNYLECGSKFSVGEDGVRIDEADGVALVATETRACLGLNAGEGNRGVENTNIGANSGRQSEGISNTNAGTNAGYLAKINSAIAIGVKAMMEALSGWYSIAIGYNSGAKSSGNYNIFAGLNSGYENVADNCIGIGDKACYQNTKDNLFELKQDNANVIPLLKGFFNTQGLVQGCPSTELVDSEINNNTLHFYLDEASNKLMVKVKYSDGTIKTGEISNLI